MKKGSRHITNQHFMVHVAYGGFWSPFPARTKSRCRGDGICGINGVAGGAAVNEGGMLFFSHCKYHLVEYEQLSCMQVLWLVSLLFRVFLLTTCWKLLFFKPWIRGLTGGMVSDVVPKFIRSFRFDLLTADRTSQRHSMIKGMMVAWCKRVVSKNVVYPEKDDLYGFLVMIWSNTCAIHHPKMHAVPQHARSTINIQRYNEGSI